MRTASTFVAFPTRAKGRALSQDDGRAGGGRISREQFLILGTAGASALLVGGYAASAVGQSSQDSVTYRGRRIVVRSVGGRPEISIDGQRLLTVDSGGAFRAAGFVFEPQSTPTDLAKKLVDYRIEVGG